jgi:hypothetical protein
VSEAKKCPKCKGAMIKGQSKHWMTRSDAREEKLKALRDSRNTASGFNHTVVRTAGISNFTKKERISHE